MVMNFKASADMVRHVRENAERAGTTISAEIRRVLAEAYGINNPKARWGRPPRQASADDNRATA